MVDFESLYPGYETADITIPAGCGGFDWSSRFLAITDQYHPNTGYDYNCIRTVAAYTAWANAVTMSGVGGQDFFFIGAAWNYDQNVTAEGWLNGSKIHSTTIVTQYDSGPSSFTFNWPIVWTW